MQFGDILRTLLEYRGITQKQLATDLNISASTLGNYIRNLRQPDFETVKTIARYFSVSTDYLLYYPCSTVCHASENELLSIFRRMSADQQAIYIAQGKAFLKHGDPE